MKWIGGVLLMSLAMADNACRDTVVDAATDSALEVNATVIVSEGQLTETITNC